LITPLITWGHSGKPLIGICLGMQMLFERGEEFETTEGLGLFPGVVKKLNPNGSKITRTLPLPHMGWNELIDQKTSNKGLAQIDQYFVHSYSAKDIDKSMILHTSTYGSELIVASVRNKNVCGFQFHPERSGANGLFILKKTILQLLNQ